MCTIRDGQARSIRDFQVGSPSVRVLSCRNRNQFWLSSANRGFCVVLFVLFLFKDVEDLQIDRKLKEAEIK